MLEPRRGDRVRTQVVQRNAVSNAQLKQYLVNNNNNNNNVIKPGAKRPRSGAKPPKVSELEIKTKFMTDCFKNLPPKDTSDRTGQPVDAIPKEILKRANEFRLMNPTQIAAASGAELEYGALIEACGIARVKIVDFKDSIFQRESGVNPLNIFYEPNRLAEPSRNAAERPQVVAFDVLPENNIILNGSFQLRTNPTYFVKARFDLNILKFYTGLATKEVFNASENVRPRKWSNAARSYFINKGASSANNGIRTSFREILKYTNTYKKESKGTYFAEPDYMYYDPSQKTLLIGELKITSGKAETFPAEAIQLAKLKTLIGLYIPQTLAIKIKTVFVPFQFGTGFKGPNHTNYRHWMRPANVTGTTAGDATRRKNLANISRIGAALTTIDPNYETMVADTPETRALAFPGLDLEIINTTLLLKRVNISGVQSFLKWFISTIVLHLYVLGLNKPEIKAMLFTRYSASGLHRILSLRAIQLMGAWLQGRLTDSMPGKSQALTNFLSKHGSPRNGRWYAGGAPGGAINTKITEENSRFLNKAEFPLELRELNVALHGLLIDIEFKNRKAHMFPLSINNYISLKKLDPIHKLLYEFCGNSGKNSNRMNVALPAANNNNNASSAMRAPINANVQIIKQVLQNFKLPPEALMFKIAEKEMLGPRVANALNKMMIYKNQNTTPENSKKILDMIKHVAKGNYNTILARTRTRKNSMAIR